MEQIRSFVAVELPENVKSGLRALQESLKSAAPTCAKWVDPESIHLTLKFLGNVDTGKIDSIIQALNKAACTVPPFHLELKGLGAFPDLRRIQVVWVGLAGDLEKLQALQQQVESGLASLGFPPEGRRFVPHLTLARMREMVSPLERKALSESLSGIKMDTNLTIPVDCISLMRSQLTRSGAIYSCLSTVKLKSSCQ